jgi:hypothetical protein
VLLEFVLQNGGFWTKRVNIGVKTVQLRVCTTLHQTIVAAWMQMAVLISKNPVTASAKQTQYLFCEFFNSPGVLCRGKRKLL